MKENERQIVCKRCSKVSIVYEESQGFCDRCSAIVTDELILWMRHSASREELREFLQAVDKQLIKRGLWPPSGSVVN